MSKNKKPTMMEVKAAINNLIHEVGRSHQAISQLNQTLGSYIEFQDNGKKFTAWIEKRIKEIQNGGDDKHTTGSVPLSNSEDRRTAGGKTNTAGKDKVIGIRKDKDKAEKSKSSNSGKSNS